MWFLLCLCDAYYCNSLSLDDFKMRMDEVTKLNLVLLTDVVVSLGSRAK